MARLYFHDMDDADRQKVGFEIINGEHQTQDDTIDILRQRASHFDQFITVTQTTEEYMSGMLENEYQYKDDMAVYDRQGRLIKYFQSQKSNMARANNNIEKYVRRMLREDFENPCDNGTVRDRNRNNRNKDGNGNNNSTPNNNNGQQNNEGGGQGGNGGDGPGTNNGNNGTPGTDNGNNGGGIDNGNNNTPGTENSSTDDTNVSNEAPVEDAETEDLDSSDAEEQGDLENVELLPILPLPLPEPIPVPEENENDNQELPAPETCHQAAGKYGGQRVQIEKAENPCACHDKCILREFDNGLATGYLFAYNKRDRDGKCFCYKSVINSGYIIHNNKYVTGVFSEDR